MEINMTNLESFVKLDFNAEKEAELIKDIQGQRPCINYEYSYGTVDSEFIEELYQVVSMSDEKPKS